MKTELKISTSVLSLVCIVLGVFYPALFAPLNSVDDTGMYHYLLNTDTFTLWGIFLPGGSGNYYRPILLTSFLADKYVWGLEESFMHLENILFHLTNTLLVFAIARRAGLLCGTKSSLAPFLAAFFFAIHPITTEAVNWISGRTDLLAGFFLLLSVLVLLRLPMTFITSCLAASCMLAACLAKETAIFFLPAAILLPFFIPEDTEKPGHLRATLQSHFAHIVIFASAGIGYILFRKLAFSQGDQGVTRVLTYVGGDQAAGVLVSLRLLLKALGFYYKKILIPFPLNFGIIHVSDGYILLGVLVCAAIVWLLLHRTVPAFFLVCAAAVGSSALMIPLLRLTWTPLAERYMYIPAAFCIIGIALSVQRWCHECRYQRFLAVGLATLAAIALYGTATRNLLWQDNLALFRDTLRKSPDFAPARNEIANALYAQGKTQEAAVIYKSFDENSDLVNSQYGLMNKAFALTEEGDFAETRRVLRKALTNPGKHEVSILKQMLEVNKIEVMQGKTTSAAVYDDSVTRLSRLYEITGDPFYQYRLGVTHLRENNRQKALEAFTITCKTSPEGIYYRKSAEKLAAALVSQTGKGVARGEKKQ